MSLLKRDQTRNKTPSQLYSLEERIDVWEDGGRICHYCDKPLPRPGTKGGKGTHFDHMIPQSKGGSHEMENLYVCCKRCNTEKGNSDYGEFLSRRLLQSKKQVRRLSELLLKYRHRKDG